MKSEITSSDGINLVLKLQLTAICDQISKPAKEIDVAILRGDLTAARETLEKAEKLKVVIDDASMACLPAPVRIHMLDHFLQMVFASFPR